MLHALEKVHATRKSGLLSRVIAVNSEGVCDENPIGR
jgi:hypothetical protein